jgi:membrane fusion protein (multidrug efflux system)
MRFSPLSPLSPFNLVTACVVVLLLGACHRPPANPPPPGPGSPPVPVAAARAERTLKPASEEIVGTVRSRQSAAVAAKLTATILELNAWPGQTVKAGEVLGLLDAREPEARLSQARALLDQAIREEARLRGLAAQRAVASQELDNAVSRREIAEAGLREAQSQASHARLTAPFDGVIVSRLAESGDLATPGRALLVIEDPGALRVEMQVPESLLGRLKVGDALPVLIPSVAVTVPARVVEIAPAADTVSRTFLVKADLPAAAGVRSGQFGRVRIPVGAASAIEVPESAILRRGQMEMVFVFDAGAGAVRQRLVRAGRSEDGRTVVLSGLEEGEWVVASPPRTIAEGDRLVAETPAP